MLFYPNNIHNLRKYSLHIYFEYSAILFRDKLILSYVLVIVADLYANIPSFKLFDKFLTVSQLFCPATKKEQTLKPYIGK